MQFRLSSLLTLLVLALSMAVSRPASAQFLSAILTNANEPPSGTPPVPVIPTLSPANGGGPRPASFGDATFFLNEARTSMTMTVNVFNIDITGTQTPDTYDNLTAAHIHASATVTPLTNAPVVWGFFGTPFNDNNPNDQMVTPFTTGVGGTITGIWNAPEGNGTTLAAQVDNILSGRSYINFHTVQFAGGEIRGHLIVTPEPGTVALVVSGLVCAGAYALPLVGVALRRRRLRQH